MPSATLEEKLERLPTEPGVYLMKDARGEVIYVGKAVNLRSRVRSYFSRGAATRAPSSPLLEHVLGDVETVVVEQREGGAAPRERADQEAPAALQRPAARRQELHLPAAGSPTQPVPAARGGAALQARRGALLRPVLERELASARRCGSSTATSSCAPAPTTCSRTASGPACCTRSAAARRPCVYPTSRARSTPRACDEVVLFLEGKAASWSTALRARMKDAAAELAVRGGGAAARPAHRASSAALERQKIATTETIDQDVFGLLPRGGPAADLRPLRPPGAASPAARRFPFTGQEFPDDELLALVREPLLRRGQLRPRARCCCRSSSRAGWSALGELLTEKQGRAGAGARAAARREGRAWWRWRAQNAEQAFLERKRSRDETAAVLERLQKTGCTCSSCRAGWSASTSRTSRARPSSPRRWRSTDGELDKVALPPVPDQERAGAGRLRQHVRGAEPAAPAGPGEATDLPDLIVIDGGKGQLASAQAAMKDLGVDGRRPGRPGQEPRPRGATTATPSRARSPERVFLLDRKDPIVLPQNSPELFMLTRLRDEAHRFAITFQQKLMRRRNFRERAGGHPRRGRGAEEGAAAALRVAEAHPRGEHRGARGEAGLGTDARRAHPRPPARAGERAAPGGGRGPGGRGRGP